MKNHIIDESSMKTLCGIRVERCSRYPRIFDFVGRDEHVSDVLPWNTDENSCKNCVRNKPAYYMRNIGN